MLINFKCVNGANRSGSQFLNFFAFREFCDKMLSPKVHYSIVFLLNEDKFWHKIFKMQAG